MSMLSAKRTNDAVQNAEHDESMAWDRVRKAEAENVKLRVLVRDLERARIALCDEYPDRLGVDCDGCPANAICDTDPAGRTRELGVVVGH